MNQHKAHLESDLNVASYLLAKGFRLLGLDTVDGRRYSFRFGDPEGHAAVEALNYLQGATAVARELFDAQKNLKSLLYRRKRGEM